MKNTKPERLVRMDARLTPSTAAHVRELATQENRTPSSMLRVLISMGIVTVVNEKTHKPKRPS